VIAANDSQTPAGKWNVRSVVRPFTYLLMGFGILALDLYTSPFLEFPILFVVPVALCAWYYRKAWAYVMAVLLPFGRFLIAEFVEKPHPIQFVIANMLIRIAVLLFVAFLVARTAQLTSQLRERVAGLVKICSWSHTIEYNGEWLSFEEYLKRRFDINTSHAISPGEAEKILTEIDAQGLGAAPPAERGEEQSKG
jgi:hypothetical protein